MRCPTEEKRETENGERKTENQNLEDVGQPTKLESQLRRIDGARMETSDRVELIERIKRGESPTWVPGRAVSGYLNCPSLEGTCRQWNIPEVAKSQEQPVF